MKNTTTLQPPNRVLRKQPNKKTIIPGRLLSDFKQGLAKAREPIDLKRGAHNPFLLDNPAFVHALIELGDMRIAHLLALCLCDFDESTSRTVLDDIMRIAKLLGVESMMGQMLNENEIATMRSRVSSIADSMMEFTMAQIQNGEPLVDIVRRLDAILVKIEYATIYSVAREESVKAVGKAGFSETFSEALALFGPRVKAEDPLSTDPILMEEERLWLANSVRIPRDQRQEVQRQLRMIAESITRTGAGRPSLPEAEVRATKADAVARSKAVRRLMRRYVEYRKDRTETGAVQLIEEKLEQNMKISAARKPGIRIAFRYKVTELECARTASQRETNSP